MREVQYGSTRFFGGRTVNADRIFFLPEKAPCDLRITHILTGDVGFGLYNNVMECNQNNIQRDDP